eukprot:XP_019078014.1 PREDICTED: uncharacterized protein LOC109123264 isoform X2 [Vitis vinifera]
MPDDRGERIENSTSATLGVHLTYGLTMASYRPHIWSGANYPVFTIYKGCKQCQGLRSITKETEDIKLGECKVLQFEATAIKDFLQGFRWFLTLFNWYACKGNWLTRR